MPSPYSSERNDLCCHDALREGCLSCIAHDSREQLQIAAEKKRMREQTIQLCETSLTQPNVTKDERERFNYRLKRTKDQLAAVITSIESRRETAAQLATEIRRICDANEPETLAQAFEADAADREEELNQIWREGAPDGKDFDLFVPEDPSRAEAISFTVFDLSHVPATPDSLVSDGVGLGVFLKLGKDLGPRLPSMAIGEQAGPAIMNYSRALQMFSNLAGSGGSVADISADMIPAAAASTSQSTTGQEPQQQTPAPRTEYEWRQQNECSSEPLLSNDEQWALFKSGKFMVDAPLLARWYVKLVKDKIQAEEATEALQALAENTGDEEDKDVTEVAAVLKSATLNDTGGWPQVEALDWAGFTNWIHRCKELDPNFGKVTLKLWRKQRKEREVIIEAIRNWVPPNDFDDGSSGHPDPETYYSSPISLTEIDMKKIGRKAIAKR